MDFLSYDGRDIILDSVADGVFTVHQDWRVTSFNRDAEDITGITREKALGQRCKDIRFVSNDVMAALLAHDFPGNIRELENIIEHCFVLCRGEFIESHDLPDFLGKDGQRAGKSLQGITTLRQMEKLMIEQALWRHQGNRAAAAKELGINPSTLFRKLKTLQIDL